MDDQLPPLEVGPEGPDGPLRTPILPRVVRRILLLGAGLAVLGAGAVGALAGDGRAAAAALFIGAALVVAVAAVAMLVGAVRGEYAGRRVPVRRVVVGLVLLLTSPVLLILAAGAAGAA